MKRVLVLCFGLLIACDDAGLAAGGGGSSFREYMVIGSSMPFEQCRAAGGLIIRDRNSSMVACDPSVRGEPAPADEFNHPTSNRS